MTATSHSVLLSLFAVVHIWGVQHVPQDDLSVCGKGYLLNVWCWLWCLLHCLGKLKNNTALSAQMLHLHVAFTGSPNSWSLAPEFLARVIAIWSAWHKMYNPLFSQAPWWPFSSSMFGYSDPGSTRFNVWS